MNRVRDQLQAGPACMRARCPGTHVALPPREDDRRSTRNRLVGGIDLSDLAGDRWDRIDIPSAASTGWHNVATRLTGPVVTDVAHTSGPLERGRRRPAPPPDSAPTRRRHQLQILRTIPDTPTSFARRGEFTILDAYLRAFGSAQQFVYLENQFLWSTEIADVLMDKLRRPPSADFRMVVVLPARPSNGADTTAVNSGGSWSDNGRRLWPRRCDRPSRHQWADLCACQGRHRR